MSALNAPASAQRRCCFSSISSGKYFSFIGRVLLPYLPILFGNPNWPRKIKIRTVTSLCDSRRNQKLVWRRSAVGRSHETRNPSAAETHYRALRCNVSERAVRGANHELTNPRINLLTAFAIALLVSGSNTTFF